jgi:hypothetical protein
MAKLTISRSRVLAVISHAGWKSGDKWDNDRLLSKISQLPEVLDDAKATPKDPQVAKDIAALLKQVEAGGAIEVVDEEPETAPKSTAKTKAAPAKPVAKTKTKPTADDEDGGEEEDESGEDSDDEPEEDEDEEDDDVGDEEEDEDEEDSDADSDEEDEDEDDSDSEDEDEDEDSDEDEDEDDDDSEVDASSDGADVEPAEPPKAEKPGKGKAVKAGRPGDSDCHVASPSSQVGVAAAAALPLSVEQTNPEPGVIEIVIRVRTCNAEPTSAPIEVPESLPAPTAVAKKVRTVPVDDEGKTLTGAPAKKTAAKSTRWHQAARTLKAAGIDVEITDKLVNKVDSAYGRANPRESRVCLVGAQAAIKSYLGGEVDASLSYSVAGAVVKKYGPNANDEKGHVLFVKLLGKPCETASHYLKNALWVIEAYRTA